MKVRANKKPTIDFKVLDAAIKKVLEYKPKKKESGREPSKDQTRGSG